MPMAIATRPFSNQLMASILKSILLIHQIHLRACAESLATRDQRKNRCQEKGQEMCSLGERTNQSSFF
jgi:cell division protein FtsB